MSKLITSPVERFPGTVKLQDPLYFPAAMAVESAILTAQDLPEGATQLAHTAAMMPAVLACVEEWNISGISPSPTIETFPTTPRVSSMRLIAWLMDEIMKLYQEAETVPNA